MIIIFSLFLFRFFNENRLQGHGNRRIQTDAHVLYIHEVTEEDEGEYMCAVFKDRQVYYDTKNLVVRAICSLRKSSAPSLSKLLN